MYPYNDYQNMSPLECVLILFLYRLARSPPCVFMETFGDFSDEVVVC